MSRDADDKRETPRVPVPADLLFSRAASSSDEGLPPGAVLEGAELERVYWRIRGRERELARQQAFWESTNVALSNAYEELEKKRLELSVTQRELVKLNAELEARVEAQVREIVANARDLEVLNAQLRVQVRDRSLELAAALERLSASESVSPLAPGAELNGRVRIVRELGHGGMGAVFLARDLGSDHLVAVKVMSPRAPPTPQLLQRFLSEARAAAAVSHPAIIRSLAIDLSEDGRIYQILEYVRGRTLAERLDEGTGDVAEVVRVGALIADALAAAHAIGVVHRDVKPSNILLCREPPSVKIFDFGIAKLRDDTSVDPVARTITGTGEIVGTPEYISPEQALGVSTVGPPSDVYSFGVVLFEWLAGRRPFEGSSVANYLFLHAAEPPPALASVVPSVPAALAALVDCCLAKEAEARPTALALAAGLAQIADAVDAPPTSRLVDEILTDKDAVELSVTMTAPSQRRSAR